MKNNLLQQYAHLLIQVGIHLVPGKKLVIRCPVERADFARLCVDEAYSAGAADVIVVWRDDAVSRQRWLRAEDSLFDTPYEWDVKMNDILSAEGAGYLSLVGENPENLREVLPERLRRFDVANGKQQKAFYRRMTNNEMPWCVAAVPVESWAKKVFPESENAVEQLWDAILRAVRIQDGEDAVTAWHEHCSKLDKTVKWLNDQNFASLRYRNSLGTDLTVKMPENHLWSAGADTSKAGVRFVANMPTEEAFSAPRRDGVDGVIFASKPLVLNGNLIDGIRLTLKEGRITDVKADSGEAVLKAAIHTDEGSHYLGEIALVPYDSPISKSGILFYETLFDENASCHFAFGEAYPQSVRNGDKMSPQELLKAGINAESAMHVDFMVGTRDLSIIGTTQDGREVPVFENGNFAFDC